MTDRLIRDARDIKLLGRFLEERIKKGPVTVDIRQGEKRSVEQNRLQWLWAHEVAQQLGEHDSAQLQALWKLHFGVPILMAEDENFASKWEEIAAALPYQKQLSLMHIWPVTRWFSTKQMTQYLDRIQKTYAERGVRLTQPDDQGVAA
jgi:hypothetical protein